jgi:hypothetical protein
MAVVCGARLVDLVRSDLDRYQTKFTSPGRPSVARRSLVVPAVGVGLMKTSRHLGDALGLGDEPFLDVTQALAGIQYDGDDVVAEDVK